MSKQDDFGWPEKTLEKTREIDNKGRISKKTEMKSRSGSDIQLRSLTSLNVPTTQMPIFVLFVRTGVLFDGAFFL